MNLFDQIRKEAEELDRKAKEYLDSVPFMSTDRCMRKIYIKAKQIFDESGEDWENIPEWVALTMDGWMPYSTIPNNGSIGFSLGFSVLAMEANLRHLVEIAEGRTDKELDLDVLAQSAKKDRRRS